MAEPDIPARRELWVKSHMHIERVLSLINLLDIPEKKRRFWPQKSLVVLAQDKTVLDVIQFFSMDESDEVLRKACQYYKHTY